MKLTITRRSIVGFGYTSNVENDENGSLRVCRVSAPTHTGTILQVCQAIADDRILASYRGGTQYSTAWFVKHNGAWHRVTNDEQNSNEMDGLTIELDRELHETAGRKYYNNVATVEVE